MSTPLRFVPHMISVCCMALSYLFLHHNCLSVYALVSVTLTALPTYPPLASGLGDLYVIPRCKAVLDGVIDNHFHLFHLRLQTPVSFWIVFATLNLFSWSIHAILDIFWPTETVFNNNSRVSLFLFYFFRWLKKIVYTIHDQASATSYSAPIEQIIKRLNSSFTNRIFGNHQQ